MMATNSTAAAPDFSRMVKDVRQALNMNQAQFAQLMGVTPAAVSLWEDGKRQPEGTALRMLYAIHEQLKGRKPAKGEFDEVLKAIAVGTAALGFIALLGVLFGTTKE